MWSKFQKEKINIFYGVFLICFLSILSKVHNHIVGSLLLVILFVYSTLMFIYNSRYLIGNKVFSRKWRIYSLKNEEDFFTSNYWKIGATAVTFGMTFIIPIFFIEDKLEIGTILSGSLGVLTILFMVIGLLRLVMVVYNIFLWQLIIIGIVFIGLGFLSKSVWSGILLVFNLGTIIYTDSFYFRLHGLSVAEKEIPKKRKRLNAWNNLIFQMTSLGMYIVLTLVDIPEIKEWISTVIDVQGFYGFIMITIIKLGILTLIVIFLLVLISRILEGSKRKPSENKKIMELYLKKEHSQKKYKRKKR
ncbi:hypothetical protein [Enterococcus faecalis]|uniref:hypothetical protein n=1 Tax=Enterococcus faecalis TaxID=1351 RepID=UPI0033911167